MDALKQILPLLMIVAVFYLFVMRPMQRQRKQVGELQSALKVGDRVMLTSGVYGVLSHLSEERAKVVVAPGVELEVIRGAIGSVDATSLAAHDGTAPEGTAPEVTGADDLPTHEEK